MTDETLARPVSLTVNGQTTEVEVETRALLVDVIRHELRLTGTHVGCAHGACGACTVLVDGRPIRSCLMLAVQADGAQVETIEGLAQGDTLSTLQEAFRQTHALQCGYCTPGMLMSAKALLAETPNPTDEEIKEAMAGNLCRCTGYAPIIRAIRMAAEGKVRDQPAA
jgi:aerobic-type carbon monoxide dehydrogenase small subunit (CoxS/CutS family)